MDKGGGVEQKFILSFNYNPSILSNEEAEKIVSKYTKNWSHNNDWDEVSFYVMDLTKSQAYELKQELKMEDVYNIDIERSRYAKGGAVSFLNKIKKYGKSSYEKSKNYAKGKVKEANLKTAVNVLNDTSNKVHTEKERIVLDIARKTIINKYERCGRELS